MISDTLKEQLRKNLDIKSGQFENLLDFLRNENYDDNAFWTLNIDDFESSCDTYRSTDEKIMEYIAKHKTNLNSAYNNAEKQHKMKEQSYGVTYTKKRNSYIIKYEEAKDGAKYDATVFNGFIDDITGYGTDGNAYDISYSKLIDLINKHATVRPPSMSIALNEEQYVLSYINERLPESFYYREHLIEWVTAIHELSDDKEQEWKDCDGFDTIKAKIDKLSKKLYYYLQTVSSNLYGCAPDKEYDYKYFDIFNYSHARGGVKSKFKCTFYSINGMLCRIVDDISKYLRGEYDSTFDGKTYLVNKYK